MATEFSIDHFHEKMQNEQVICASRKSRDEEI